MSEAKEPESLEGSTPVINREFLNPLQPESKTPNEIIKLDEHQRRGSQRWRTPLKIGLFLILAGSAGFTACTTNNQDQSAKEANFGLAKTTAQTEVNKVPARATEFTAIVAPTATVEPTVTAKPSPTEKPTVEPTKAASSTEITTATPETPKVVSKKVVSKTIEEIIPKLLQEAQKGHLMVVDVWSAQGVKVEEAATTSGFDGLAFNGYKPGDIFISPIVGKIDSVTITQTQGNDKSRSINIIAAGIKFTVVVSTKDEVLVKDGDDIIPGMPLAKLTGELLPANSGISKNGKPYYCQSYLAADTKGTKFPLGKDSILKENEIVVNIAPKLVYKNITEIKQKLKEEASKGNFMIVDVWSAQGVKIEETRTAAGFIGFNSLAFNDYEPGDIFISPIVGKIDYVAIGEVRGGTLVKTIHLVTTEGIYFDVTVDTKDEFLVKDGDDIIPGTPLAKLTGELLPANSGVLKYGKPYRCQAFLTAVIDNRDVFGKNSILKENGMAVNIAP